MFNRLSFILILGLIASSGYAADAGTAVTDCPRFGEIVRKITGGIRYMNQSDAFRYCARHGMHLPSARELAQLATSMGAIGIANQVKDAAYIVSAKNVDGKVDTFYFNGTGYMRPEGDLGNVRYWSSSVNPDNFYGAYVFDAINGVIGYYYRNDDGLNPGDSEFKLNHYNAVRCVEE